MMHFKNNNKQQKKIETNISFFYQHILIPTNKTDLKWNNKTASTTNGRLL
jgi:Zn-dependent peptidase ImmA (M78 family)